VTSELVEQVDKAEQEAVVTKPNRLSVGAFLCVAFAAGCSAPSDSSAPPGELPEGDWLDETSPGQVLTSEYCSSPQPGDTPLRRLTNAEYRNTLEDLGLPRDEVDAATASFPSEPVSLGFRNGARTLHVDTLMSQQYARVAIHFRDRLATDCGEVEERECMTTFVSGLGKKLFRRPLKSEEAASFLAIFDKAKQGGDTTSAAMAWVVEAMLLSPEFLYRVEIPEEETAKVSDYEMASRLSYTFWQSPPDQELLDAAEAGELRTADQIEGQVRRLLGDRRALRVYEFFRQWLDLDELISVDRDEALYPDLPGNLAALLLTENEAFVKSLLSRGDADLKELLSAPYTYANADLARHYGLEGPEGAAFEKVPAPERSGILSQGMLAVQDGPTRTSIVRRGLKIRTDLLCQLVPAPPDSVNLTLDGIGADLTQAERLAQHRENPSCAQCHSMMDPIGAVFEGFDAVGRPREVDEYGSPVSSEGEVAATFDLDGPYASVPELGRAMGESREVEQCYLMQNFRFFFGREAERSDLCSQAQLTEHFQESGQSLAELFVGLARTDAFRYKAGLLELNGGSEGASRSAEGEQSSEEAP
jgi:hypothetical protein